MSNHTPYLPKPQTPPRRGNVLPPATLAASPTSLRAVRSYVGQRVQWRGHITEIVAAPPLLCLGGVTDEAGIVVWDCLWLHRTKNLQVLCLAQGDVLEFVARVDRQLDSTYALNRPNNFTQVALGPVTVPVAADRSLLGGTL